MSDLVKIQRTKEDWGPGTKLLAALKVERDPKTWLITVPGLDFYFGRCFFFFFVCSTRNTLISLRQECTL